MAPSERKTLIWLSGWIATALAGLFLLWNAFSRQGTRAAPRASAAAMDVADKQPLVVSAARAKAKTSQTIDEAQREYLWEVEHHGNLLAEHGFSAIAKALAAGDGQRLAGLLADDFSARLPGEEHQVSTRTEYADVVRRRLSESSQAAVDGEAFVAQMLDYRAIFGGEEAGAAPPKAKLSLKALSPTDRDDLDSPWQGSCLLRMWGQSEPGKPAEVALHLEYTLARPTEQAFEQDGWLQSCTVVQSQVARASRFLLEDVAVQRGLAPNRLHDNWKEKVDIVPVTGGIYCCDFNRDGRLDLLVTDIRGLQFYQGIEEGRFTDVTKQVGLPPIVYPMRGAVGFADLDGDGWEDLILNDLIYRNESGRRFTNVSHQSNLRMSQRAGGLALADFDRDGRVDVYSTVPGEGKSDSWIDGRSGLSDTNQLWRNLGHMQFEDVTKATNTAGGKRSTFTAVWLDANNDGWPDLHVINEFGSGGLLVNPGEQGGPFTEQLLADGPADFGSMGATAGDIDNDGNIDLYIGNMYSKAGNRVIGNLKPDSYPPEIMAVMGTYTTGSQLWKNNGKLGFDRLGQKFQVADVGWSYGPALIDFDNDGWLDIYATAGFVSRTRDKPDG